MVGPLDDLGMDDRFNFEGDPRFIEGHPGRGSCSSKIWSISIIGSCDPKIGLDLPEERR